MSEQKRGGTQPPVRDRTTTRHGYAGVPGGPGDDDWAAATIVDKPLVPAAVPVAPGVPAVPGTESGRRGRQPTIDVTVVHEHGPPSIRDTPWRSMEVWTRNRVYTVDSNMICVEVINRATNKMESHAFVGARLTGGQRRGNGKVEISNPYPLPGTEAVFQIVKSAKKSQFGTTSRVERVVIRVRLTSVMLEDPTPAWEELSASHRLSDLKLR